MRSKRIISALKHKKKLGGGSAKRRKLNLNKSEEFEAIMLERKRGTLLSGSGKVVKSIPQAKAIAISELKKRGKWN